MAQRCPECDSAVEGAPWCGACGARLATQGSTVTDGQDHARGRPLRIAAALGILAMGAAVAVTSGGPPPAASQPEQGVPVEEAEVLTPALPAPRGMVERQFAVRGSTLWERTDLPARDGAFRSLVSDGAVVAVLDGDDTVLTVDATTGEDVVGASPTAPDGTGFSFGAAGEELRVEVDVTTLRGVVADEIVWQVRLEGPPAAPPVRTGTSLVIALSTGEVVAIAPSDGSERWRRDLGSDATAVAGDGTVLLVGTSDGRVLRLDPSGMPVTTVQVAQGPVRGLAAGRPAAVLVDGRLVGLDVAG